MNEVENMRQVLELQQKLIEAKQEIKALSNTTHLLTRRIENAVSYLTATSRPEPRIAAALVQLKQAQEGR